MSTIINTHNVSIKDPARSTYMSITSEFKTDGKSINYKIGSQLGTQKKHNKFETNEQIDKSQKE